MFLKSLFWQGVNNLIKLFLEIFIFDKKIRRILKGNWAKFYLRKYVLFGTAPARVSTVHKVHQETLPSPLERDNSDLHIWQYWESPDGTVPPLVQACLNSVEKYSDKYKRVLLTYDTVRNYVELPEYIYKMKETGKMCMAHFTDIVRTALLAKYGGVWVDSTVLFTDIIPEYITGSDLFFFGTKEKEDLDGLCGTNYLIAASKPNNQILLQVLDSMLAYWRENRFLVNYFSHMHIITMVCKKNPDLYSKIPFYSFYPVQQLQWELLSPFNEARWEQIKNITSIHKLTHKTKVLTKKKNFDSSGTFYEHVLQEFGT